MVFTKEMLERDRAIREKQAALDPKPPQPQVEEKSDVALAQEEVVKDTAAADTSGENYGELDMREIQPGERVLKIPLGGAGMAEIYYDPLTRIARPIPASSTGV